MCNKDGTTIRVIEETASKWKHIATALGFNGPRIESIEMDSCFRVEVACMQVFIKWLDGEHDLRKPISWATLIQCLREERFTELANDLAKCLTTSVSSCGNILHN